MHQSKFQKIPPPFTTPKMPKKPKDACYFLNIFQDSSKGAVLHADSCKGPATPLEPHLDHTILIQRSRLNLGTHVIPLWVSGWPLVGVWALPDLCDPPKCPLCNLWPAWHWCDTWSTATDGCNEPGPTTLPIAMRLLRALNTGWRPLNWPSWPWSRS